MENLNMRNGNIKDKKNELPQKQTMAAEEYMKRPTPKKDEKKDEKINSPKCAKFYPTNKRRWLRWTRSPTMESTSW